MSTLADAFPEHFSRLNENKAVSKRVEIEGQYKVLCLHSEVAVVPQCEGLLSVVVWQLIMQE